MKAPSSDSTTSRAEARIDPPRPSSPTPRRQRTLAVVTLVRDATLLFTQRFLNRRDPAARDLATTAAEARNAIHGAEHTGQERDRLELARQHLTHLLTGLETFLDSRRLRRWVKDDAEARAVRTVGQRCSVGQVGHQIPAGVGAYAEWLERGDPGVVANTIVCLIHQANYLLDRQVLLLRQGFTPDPAAAANGPRRSTPGEKLAATTTAVEAPDCPKCGLPMIPRMARRGSLAGRPFWGCSGYPRCGGIRPNEKAADMRPRP